jgi:hypothetical protein
MTRLPPDKQLIEEIRKTMKTAPHMMQCVFCSNYCPATGDCSVTHMKFTPYVRGCNGKFFLTNEELLLKKVKDEMMAELLECDKTEAFLALSVAHAGASECGFAEVSRRTRELRKKTKDKNEQRLLRKDMDMTDEAVFGFQKINEVMDELWDVYYQKKQEMLDAIDAKLESIDQRYGWYVQNNINKLFSEKGKLNIKNTEGLLNNSMDIFRESGYYVKACIGNEENHKRVFDLLRILSNETPYALEHKDFDRFQIKG